MLDMRGMSKEQWNINCADCGRFIFTEERECVGGDIKCVAGSHDDGYYDGNEDVFYCSGCAEKHKIKV